jgi:parallel beta-helix repeat protein
MTINDRIKKRLNRGGNMRTINSLFVVLFILLSSVASATILHVPGDYSHIQTAITFSDNGDTVLVADGIYTENIDFSGKSILVKSQNGPTYTTIEMNSSAPVVTFNHGEGRGSILRGFTLSGDSTFYGVYIYNASPTIYGNIIKKHEVGIRVDNGGSPLIRKNEITLCSHSDYPPHNGGGIRMQGASGAVIDSNEIHHNYSNVAGGIFLYLCSDITVERNLIYSNSSVYIGGLEMSTSDNIRVYNNTLVDNSSNTTNLGSINCSVTDHVTVAGNISAFNYEYGIYSYQENTNLVTCYNDVYGNNPGNHYNLSPGTGSISSDPLFVDRINDDFNLDTGSPCINAGDPTRPLDPDGTTSDMGALYYPLGPLAYGSLAGALTDTSGIPVQNAHVVELYYGHEGWTDINGEYIIDSLFIWNGYYIQFSHPDFLDTTIYDVEITEDDTTTLDVVMSPIPDPGIISGTVTDDSMVPIESVHVVISYLGLDTYTDSNGDYIFEDLLPDEYDLIFTHPDFAPQYYYDVVVISNETTDLDVIL